MWPIEQVLGGTVSGIREDVDWEQYLAMPALNPSTIVYGLESMKHLRHAWDHPQEDTDDLLWGRAVHCLLFEPKEFEHRYIAWREADADGKPKARHGAKWDELLNKATELDLEILSAKQWDSALEAAKSFVGEPEVQKLIAAGKPEVTVLDVEYDIQCRGRIDWIATSTAIVDLKTTRNIRLDKFGRDFYAFKYDVKLGLYQRWLNKLTGLHWPVKVIALEKKPPYDIAVIPVPDAVLDRGAAKGLEVIKQVRECLDTGFWPGVTGGEEGYLDTPTWEMEDGELEGAEEVFA